MASIQYSVGDVTYNLTNFLHTCGNVAYVM